jgi:outer membrane phospholipase A
MFSIALLMTGLVNMATSTPAVAAILYSLDRPTAAPGDTVQIRAMYFNDGANSLTFEAPARIVIEWRAADGTINRSFALAKNGATQLNIPVNNFADLTWETVVPKHVQSLQAIAIEGTATLLALEATGRDSGTPATTVAVLPRHPSNPGFERLRSALSEYEPVYFAVGTRTRTTARFQISAKYQLFSATQNGPPTFINNLYFGYTQISLWDLQAESAPFLDTSFNPSAFWLNRNIWTSSNDRWRVGGQAGAEHKSNGKGGADSRSINDAFVTPQLSYLFHSGSALMLAPKVKAYFQVARENPDYSDYAGHVDWQLKYAHHTGAVLSALYQQGRHQRRTTQLDLAWPLKRMGLDINGYVHLQYFNGYGETLLGYNEKNRSQLRIGLSVVP